MVSLFSIKIFPYKITRSRGSGIRLDDHSFDDITIVIVKSKAGEITAFQKNRLSAC